MLQKIERGLLIAFILLFPSQLGIHFWPKWSVVLGRRIDFLSPTIYFSDLLILGILITYYFRITNYRLGVKISDAIVILLLLVFTNLILSFHPLLSLLKFLRLFLYGLLFLYVLNSGYDFKKLLSRYFPLNIIVVCSIGISQFIKNSSLGGVFYWLGERDLSGLTSGLAKINLGELGYRLRSYSIFSHPNSLAGYLLLSIILLYYLDTRKAIYITPLVLIGLFITFSKTVFLTGILLTILYFGNKYLKYENNSTSFVLTIFIMSIFVLSLTFSTFMQLDTVVERFSQMNFFRKIPPSAYVFGMGFGVSPTMSGFMYQPVHNLLLLIILELGIIFPSFLLNRLRPFFVYILKRGRYIMPFLAVMFTGMADHYWLTLNQNIILITIWIIVIYQEYQKKYVRQ